MPKEVFNKDYAYLPHSDLLNFEEITRLAKVFVACLLYTSPSPRDCS